MDLRSISYIIKEVISTKAKRRRKQKKEHKTKTYYVWILKLESIGKIFVPWIFDGTNYPARPSFARKIVLGTCERELQYNEHAAVCITVDTPITMIYDIKNSTLKFSFSI